MDWSTKKFHYKIVDEDTGKTIAFFHNYLEELEEFINKSNLQLQRLERKGPNNFLVQVLKLPGWKI